MVHVYSKQEMQGARIDNIKNTYRIKTKVLAQKRTLSNFHSGINLNKSDIIPIVNDAVSRSFEITSSKIPA